MSEAEGLLRLTLAAAFGAVIGWEREDRDKPAGMRTFSIVALGSALFSLVGLLAFGMGDAGARIPAQVVTGVGFLGAGTILHHRGNVIGLTTAAGIWGAAAVGMGFGFGLYVLSAGATVIMLALLRILGRIAPTHGTSASDLSADAADRDDGHASREEPDRGPEGEGDPGP
jgi:putative Mg2+ transporter-C (MgtC) family protein